MTSYEPLAYFHRIKFWNLHKLVTILNFSIRLMAFYFSHYRLSINNCLKKVFLKVHKTFKNSVHIWQPSCLLLYLSSICILSIPVWLDLMRRMNKISQNIWLWYLLQCDKMKAESSMCKCVELPESSLLPYTRNRCRLRLRPKFSPT